MVEPTLGHARLQDDKCAQAQRQECKAKGCFSLGFPKSEHRHFQFMKTQPPPLAAHTAKAEAANAASHDRDGGIKLGTNTRPGISETIQVSRGVLDVYDAAMQLHAASQAGRA